jgi:uncharacterized protein YbbC (DUF1343 family)
MRLFKIRLNKQVIKLLQKYVFQMKSSMNVKAMMFIFIGFFFLLSLKAQEIAQFDNPIKTDAEITVGARRLDLYLPIIQGKTIAIVGNHTSLIGSKHLVDSLLALHVKIKVLFCPEHGFRGKLDAGEDVDNSRDKKTGLPIISLYGDHKKPSLKELDGVDLVLFDLQDVGARFYTYLSTLHYVMEACAEAKKELIVLDRPNPNGYYIDGPVMEQKHKSFVGLHPVPVVYGMTIGEYAQMVNGEGWLAGAEKCNLRVIPLLGYSHADLYQLPVPPSPNLSTMAAVYLYPSLCLFEGTIISVGRGTDYPFQVIGHPKLQGAKFSFTPESKPGALNPLYKGQKCLGMDLREFGKSYIPGNRKLYLFWLEGCYKNTADKSHFFNTYFLSLSGTDSLEQQIKEDKPEEQIRASWQPAMKIFKKIRLKYLMYPDFE